jgi:hypothetical protein
VVSLELFNELELSISTPPTPNHPAISKAPGADLVIFRLATPHAHRLSSSSLPVSVSAEYSKIRRRPWKFPLKEKSMPNTPF